MRRKENILLILIYIFMGVFCLDQTAFAAQSLNPDSLGGVAATLTTNFGALARLITAGSYVAGMGFGVGAILKFKAHKDNPTQIPIGTPIALVFIAAAMIFLPSLFKVAGYSMFNNGGHVGGISGITNFIS